MHKFLDFSVIQALETMGNSVKKGKKKDINQHSQDVKWQNKTIIRYGLNSKNKIISIDITALNNTDCLMIVSTNKYILIKHCIIKQKKKKLDCKNIIELADCNGRNVLIHPIIHNIFAVQFDDGYIKIYQLFIENKSCQLLDKVNFNKVSNKNDIKFIDNNMYFIGKKQIIYTAKTGKIYIYDFMQKQVINTINLTSIISNFNCIDYIYKHNNDINKCLIVFAKDSNSKETKDDCDKRVFIADITKYLSINNDNVDITKQLLYYHSDINKFLHFSDECIMERKSFSLKLFKQYQSVSFSPNMEFLSIACGSSIDIFNYCDKTFNYINYHNYGGNIQCVKWLNANSMIVICKTDQIGSYKSIMTEIIVNDDNAFINDIISDLFKDEIIEIIISYLRSWKIRCLPIDLIMNKMNKTNDKTNDDSFFLRGCMDINDGRGGMIIGTKSRPEFIVSLV